MLYLYAISIPFSCIAAQQRQHVAKFPRDVLEDKYLRMYEEYIILKKYARKQEDKIKRFDFSNRYIVYQTKV